MTLRFVDSFDHYVTADFAEKWTAITAGPTINASTGRRSTASMRITGQTRHVTKTIDAQATWIVGFAFQMANAPSSNTNIVALRDAGTIQCDLRVNTDGTLSVTRNGTVLGTSTFALSAAVFYFIELKITIHNSTGTAEIKVDGSSKLALTSQDTQNTANATANEILVGMTAGASSGFTCDYDDLYVCDAAGSTNNNFLGDCRVDYYAPSGNGNSSQLVGSDGNSTDNYLLVDEAAPNDDTDYNESATVGNKDTYACANMSHTPSSIFGVQLCMHAKKDDAGARSITGVTRSGTTDFDGATEALSTSYIYYNQIRETDPNTSAAWTKTNFDASEHGVKVAA